MSGQRFGPAGTALIEEMIRACRTGEFAGRVREWCEANNGCKSNPCTCAGRFVQPDFDGRDPIVLQFKPAPDRKLSLAWSRDAK